MALYNTYDLLSEYPFTVYEALPAYQRKKKKQTENQDEPQDKLSSLLNLIQERQNTTSTSSTNTIDDDDEVVEFKDPLAADDNDRYYYSNNNNNNTSSISTEAKWKNVTFEDFLKQTNLDQYIQITSTLRDPDKNKRVGGSPHSWHLQSRAQAAGHMGAVDIVPKSGYDFDYIFNLLTNNKDFEEWAKTNRYNINDETSRKGYGRHLHLGPDSFISWGNKYHKEYYLS